MLLELISSASMRHFQRVPKHVFMEKLNKYLCDLPDTLSYQELGWIM